MYIAVVSNVINVVGNLIGVFDETLCRYLDFQDQRQILGTGCGTAFPKQAYEFGKCVKIF